jgi:hypothetical protein
MSAPVGPLLQELAKRILANLDHIEKEAPTWGGSDQDNPPYSDTQLLISLLGVLVFPHERTSGALGELLKDYEGLSDVVTIRYLRDALNPADILTVDGERERIDPTDVTDLPRLLRNSIAHFNVRPINNHGRFGGVRVWNRNKGKITFVADLDFDKLRPMARHILVRLERADKGLTLDDPPDPLDEVEADALLEGYHALPEHRAPED